MFQSKVEILNFIFKKISKIYFFYQHWFLKVYQMLKSSKKLMLLKNSKFWLWDCTTKFCLKWDFNLKILIESDKYSKNSVNVIIKHADIWKEFFNQTLISQKKIKDLIFLYFKKDYYVTSYFSICLKKSKSIRHNQYQ